MVTSIQLDEKNLKLLGELKKATGARSYNEVLDRLLEKEMKVPKSMFGVARGRLTPFTEADRLENRE